MIGFVPTPAPRPELPQNSAPDAERVRQTQSQPYGANQPFGEQQEYWPNQQYGKAASTDELPHAPAPQPDRFAPPPV